MLDDVVFPCSSSSETLRFDVYSMLSANSAANDEYNFIGTVTDRLNVLSDPKQIKDHLKAAAGTLATPPSRRHSHSPAVRSPEKSARPVGSLQMSSLHSSLNPYSVLTTDSIQDVAAKFLALVALGPITRANVELRLAVNLVVPLSELNELFSTHTQPYLPNDTFIEADVYPSLALGATEIDPQLSYVILKDKAYKELRPWNIPAYTDYERGLVIDNANNALSRLGYLETHPLRRRIVEKSASIPSHKKTSSLGGGILVSGRKSTTASSSSLMVSALAHPGSPLIAGSYKKSFTESPKLHPERKHESKKNDTSPLKDGAKRKYVASLSLSGSSSEDEKQAKRVKKDCKRSNSSTSHISVNSNATSCTLPSSVNDEVHGEDEQSEDDTKLLTMPKTVSSLPSRPQISASTAEKKQQYYSHLAAKFKVKYLEYEKLHRELSKEHRRGNAAEKKKLLMKLFELHNSLAEWKRKLWNYHNESNLTEGIMNLSRHRKTSSGSSLHAHTPVSTPSSSQFLSHDKFHTSPASPAADRFPMKPQAQRHVGTGNRTRLKHKVALDY